MAEGLGDPEGLSTPDIDTDASTDTAALLVDADGKFSEGWRDLLDEDLREEKSLESIKDIGSLARSYVHTKRMVGADTIKVPSEKSTEAEWEELFDRIGRPKTSDEYELPIPEEYKEHYNEDLIQAGRSLFHKIGLSQKQAQALWAFEQQRLEKAVADQAANAEAEMRSAEEALRQKWGDKFDARIHLANRMIAENTADEENKNAVVAAIGNNPHVADFLANIGEKFIEHKVITDIDGSHSAALDLERQIHEEMAKDAYKNAQNPDHKLAVAKVARLFEQKNANAQRLADRAR